MIIEKIAYETNTSEETVKAAALAARGGAGKPADSDDIEYGEYLALRAPDRENDPRDKFQKRRIRFEPYLDNLPDDAETQQLKNAASVIQSIHAVDRLRIVRALTGFSRILRDADKSVPVDLGKGSKWKPAIEYFGEGIFIDFKVEELIPWAERTSKADRMAKLVSRFEGLPAGLRSSFPGGLFFRPTPRFLFLHTLSHILMLKLQFFCGYSSSAIREKIYCSFPGIEDEMCGILIFTSSGDVEGSMGGLARMAEAANLLPLLYDSILDARDCSYDPVCLESQGQGLDALNLAACHACALVPETSCNYRNQFLDRAVLIDPTLGYFNNLKGMAD